MSNCFVATIDPSLAKKIQRDLEERGFEITKPPHTLFAAKRQGVSLSLYTSGKLTIQGKDKDELIEYYIEPEILKTFTYSHKEATLNTRERIGCDEAGKGDLFGPLVVSAVHATAENILELQKLGVTDSKNLNDSKILNLAPKIRKLCIHKTLALYPKKYNELYAAFNNLNSLLAWCHATAIFEVVNTSGCRDVHIDKFANEAVMEKAINAKNLDISLTQQTKYESDIVVASASVLARAGFLEGIEKLSKEYGMNFPKGASNIAAKSIDRFVTLYGKEMLSSVGKVHFKTFNIVI